MNSTSQGGSADKYESHTRIDDLTIIFASITVILVRQTKVHSKRSIIGPEWGWVSFLK